MNNFHNILLTSTCLRDPACVRAVSHDRRGLLGQGAESDYVARGGGGGRGTNRHLDDLRLDHQLVNLLG